MIFVGSGALLARAATHAMRAGLTVDLICCERDDYCLPAFRKTGAPILETDDPNADLPPLLNRCVDGVAFSINNRHILRDEIIGLGVSFFNIHSGLVQNYRGVSEVCMFAALCNGDTMYGVTLHRIFAGQRVDSGLVIAQTEFAIGDRDTFSELMTKSLAASQRVFETEIDEILSGTHAGSEIQVSPTSYTYRDVIRLCQEAHSERLTRASNLGHYATYFPRLKSIVDAECRLYR